MSTDPPLVNLDRRLNLFRRVRLGVKLGPHRLRTISALNVSTMVVLARDTSSASFSTLSTVSLSGSVSSEPGRAHSRVSYASETQPVSSASRAPRTADRRFGVSTLVEELFALGCSGRGRAGSLTGFGDASGALLAIDGSGTTGAGLRVARGGPDEPDGISDLVEALYRPTCNRNVKPCSRTGGQGTNKTHLGGGGAAAGRGGGGRGWSAAVFCARPRLFRAMSEP